MVWLARYANESVMSSIAMREQTRQRANIILAVDFDVDPGFRI